MVTKKGKAKPRRKIPLECCLTCRYHNLMQMEHYCNHFDSQVQDSETLLWDRSKDGQLCWRPPIAILLEADRDG